MKLLTGLGLFSMAAVHAATVPLFMWSSEKHFSGSGCSDWEAPEVLSAHDLMTGVQFLAEGGSIPTQTQIAKYLSKSAKQPEAVVAFVYNSLCSSEAARSTGAYSENSSKAPLAFLQVALTEAKSCVSAPYLTASSTPTSKLLSQAFKANKGQVVTLELSAKHDCHSLLAALAEHDHLFNNGVTDLLVVKSTSLDDLTSKCFKKVQKAVETETSDFVSLLTADSASHVITTSFDTKKRSALESPVPFDFNEVRTAASVQIPVPKEDEPDIDNVNQYTEIVFALFVSLFMIMFLLIAFSCMMGIETPMRFPNKNMVIAKEY